MNRALRKRLDRLDGQTSGKPRWVVVNYDSSEMTEDEAVDQAHKCGLLKPGDALMVFPVQITLEDWEALVPLWHECIVNGAKWHELPFWAGGGAKVPKLKFDGGKLNA